MGNINVKSVPIPVRLDASMRQRLRMTANRMGTTTSGVIRFAVVQQLQQIETGVIRLTDVSKQDDETIEAKR